MKLIIPLTIIIFTLIALPTQAGLLDRIGPECFECGACSLCDILSVFFQVGKYIFSFMAGIALILVISSGLMMIFSMGNAEQLANGKKLLFNSLIGIVIIMISWTLVNALIMVLSDNKPTNLFTEGQWWQGPKCEKLSCAVPSSPAGPTDPPSTLCQNDQTGYCCGLRMSGIKPSQCADASDSLKQILQCIYQKASEATDVQQFKITSISDDDGFIRCQTNYNSSVCDHTRNSCHYGGPNKASKSMAADFSSQNFTDAGATWFRQMVIGECHGQFNDERFIRQSDGTLVPSNAPHFHVSSNNCGAL